MVRVTANYSNCFFRFDFDRPVAVRVGTIDISYERCVWEVSECLGSKFGGIWQHLAFFVRQTSCRHVFVGGILMIVVVNHYDFGSLWELICNKFSALLILITGSYRLRKQMNLHLSSSRTSVD